MISKPYTHIDLSVVIPALNEAENLSKLLPRICQILCDLRITFEILVVDEAADKRTEEIVNLNRAILLKPESNGYGAALAAGFEHASGDYIATMDADFSHPAQFLCQLWAARNTAEVIVASRYIKGGKTQMPLARYLLSRILNVFFSRGLNLQVRDMSSGYRLYSSSVLSKMNIISSDFNVLQEILVKAFIEGYQVWEIPFDYHPRRSGSSHARVLKFGIAYAKTFSQLWRIRNSIASADYDARAYVTLFPPQRYWQRQRYKHITNFIKGQGKSLDVGCGSSYIIQSLSQGSVALDILTRKLRYARRFGKDLIQGSGFALPISSQSFPCVICSQVIEHVPRGLLFDELDRVLEPGGLLILGTPDYSKWQWRLIERIYKLVLPQAYADEHVTHYTYQELFFEFVTKRSYTLEAKQYILAGELILALRKSTTQVQPK